MRYIRPRTLTVPARAHPLVKFVFTQMKRQQVGLSDMEERSGVTRETISAWRTRNSPNLANIEAVNSPDSSQGMKP
jgi:hypothetical protein